MYNDKVEIRDVEVDGETNWYWIKGDTGCFNGASDDWVGFHKEKYFTHVKNFDTIVTAGTNCGMYVRFYAKKFKHVYAFEPEPIAFYCMVNSNPVDNVVKMNCALGHGHGIVGIHRTPPGGPELNVGMNVIQNATEEFKIPMITIDSLGLQACDLLQLDLEGFEIYALQGAKNTILKYKPVIAAERFNKPEDKQFMAELGYRYVDQSNFDAIYIPSDINSDGEVFVYQS